VFELHKLLFNYSVQDEFLTIIEKIKLKKDQYEVLKIICDAYQTCAGCTLLLRPIFNDEIVDSSNPSNPL
jgi:hypothetical protein